MKAKFDYKGKPVSIHIMLSIIIPSRGGDNLKDCLKAIDENTVNYEVIVEKDGGFAEALNNGVKKAKGDHIILLHDDILVTKGWADKLATVGAFSVKELNVGWVWGGFYPGSYCTDHKKNPDYSMFLCISKKVAKKIFPLDETFTNPWCQDVDMGFTVRTAGYKIKCLPGKIIHNWAGGEHTGSNEAYLKEKWGI